MVLSSVLRKLERQPGLKNQIQSLYSIIIYIASHLALNFSVGAVFWIKSSLCQFSFLTVWPSRLRKSIFRIKKKKEKNMTSLSPMFKSCRAGPNLSLLQPVREVQAPDHHHPGRLVLASPVLQDSCRAWLRRWVKNWRQQKYILNLMGGLWVSIVRRPSSFS